ncbi:hypothetical protein QJQ45_015641, partial [Haematococcus lacustris]
MNGEAAPDWDADPDWAKKKRQPYRKGNPFVADLYAKLQLSTALRKEHYNIIINTADKLVKLLCLLCLAQLAVSNITQQQKDHSGCAACLAAQRLRGLHAAPLPPPPNSYQPTGLGLMMCTDGWRHKRAAKGQPLVNLVLLKAEGGAFFHSVCQLNKSDRKDAQFYVDLHNDLANKVMKIWRDLSTWAEQWADAHGDPIGVNGVDPHFVLGVPRLFNDRAKKHYQPVMAAARVLDPVNFLPTRPRAQPLPPMKDLTPEEQEDVVHVVARLAEVSEAEARRELRRFESGTWHPEMTRVANDIMSMAEAGERDGRAVTIIAPASQRLTWWQLLAQPHFPALAKAALRLLSVHVSTCAAERNWSAWGRLFADALRSSMDMATAEKLVFIQTNDELATNSDNFDKYNGASGSGQQDQEQGQGQAVKEVIGERRQVIKAAFRGLVDAARPDLSPAEDQPPPPAQDQPPAQPPPGPVLVQRPQAPPWGRWLDRDTNGCLNLQRIGESKQRPLELCQWDDLEALPP